MQDLRKIRQRTETLLQQSKIPSHPHLPLLDVRDMRASDEVADKIVSLYCLAGIANGADSGMLLQWLTEEGALSALGATDKRILEDASLPKTILNELSWKQESLYTLCWASGTIEELHWPDKECDLSNAFPAIPPEVPIDRFKRSLTMRESSTIMAALDLYYNLHASLSHPELWSGRSVTAAMKIEIVLERRQALEWLCANSVDWDDTNLNT